eukprot:190732-Chlamydomonas_euryale.AAC.17
MQTSKLVGQNIAGVQGVEQVGFEGAGPRRRSSWCRIHTGVAKMHVLTVGAHDDTIPYAA